MLAGGALRRGMPRSHGAGGSGALAGAVFPPRAVLHRPYADLGAAAAAADHGRCSGLMLGGLGPLTWWLGALWRRYLARRPGGGARLAAAASSFLVCLAAVAFLDSIACCEGPRRPRLLAALAVAVAARAAGGCGRGAGGRRPRVAGSGCAPSPCRVTITEPLWPTGSCYGSNEATSRRRESAVPKGECAGVPSVTFLVRRGKSGASSPVPPSAIRPGTPGERSPRSWWEARPRRFEPGRMSTDRDA
jgi:hypothetical protein